MVTSNRHETEASVIQGNQFFRERRFDQAIKAFTEFLRRHPDNRNVRYNLSRALLAQGRLLFERKNYNATIDAMKASLEAWPGDADALSSLGTACRKAARYQEARDNFLACLQASTQVARPYEFFHYVYCGALADGAQVILRLLAVVELNVATASVHDFWHGVHAYNSGQLDEGILLMRSSGVDFMRGAGNLRTRAEIERMLKVPRHATQRAVVQWWHGTPTGSDAVIMNSCDWVYFLRYREQLIRSLRVSGFSGTIHFHIINPGNDLFTEIERTMAMSEGEPIGISSEIMPNPTPSYYAIARFIALPEIAAHYAAPILVSDADLRYAVDPRQILDFSAGADIGLLDRPLFFPWMRINASFSLWRQTAASLELARLLSAYLVELNAETQEWMADQSALGQIGAIARELVPGVVLSNLEPARPFDRVFATVKIPSNVVPD